MSVDCIAVCLDSGASCDSCHRVVIPLTELDCDSRAAWDAKTDDERAEAVRLYWLENGLPEIHWEDATEAEL